MVLKWPFALRPHLSGACSASAREPGHVARRQGLACCRNRVALECGAAALGNCGGMRRGGGRRSLLAGRGGGRQVCARGTEPSASGACVIPHCGLQNSDVMDVFSSTGSAMNQQAMPCMQSQREAAPHMGPLTASSARATLRKSAGGSKSLPQRGGGGTREVLQPGGPAACAAAACGDGAGSQFRSPICFRTACRLLSRTKVCFDIKERRAAHAGCRVQVRGRCGVECRCVGAWRQRSVRLIGY